MTELQIQSKAFQTIWNFFPKTRGLFYHIPNGGGRTIVEGANLKASGVIAGIPDMHLAIPNGDYPSMYIEVKKMGGMPSQKQFDVHEKLIEAGNEVCVCFSAKGIINAVVDYLKETSYISAEEIKHYEEHGKH